MRWRVTPPSTAFFTSNILLELSNSALDFLIVFPFSVPTAWPANSVWFALAHCEKLHYIYIRRVKKRREERFEAERACGPPGERPAAQMPR